MKILLCKNIYDDIGSLRSCKKSSVTLKDCKITDQIEYLNRFMQTFWIKKNRYIYKKWN